MPSHADREILTVAGREVAISNPRKVLFPDAGYTKLDLARYCLSVSDGALRGVGGRPTVLVRYPDGIDGEFFHRSARQARGRRGSRSWRCAFLPAAAPKKWCLTRPTTGAASDERPSRARTES